MIFTITYAMPLTEEFDKRMVNARDTFIRMKNALHDTRLHAKSFARKYGYTNE